MKERPILFNSQMVRALLEGRKTQTRRVVNWPLVPAGHDEDYDPYEIIGGMPFLHWNPGNGLDSITPVASPYGQPGDRLWVKENYLYDDWTEDGYPKIKYQADSGERWVSDIPEEWGEKLSNIWTDLSRKENFEIDKKAADRKWRPSIFLPRWASRITLEVTGVRVERLNEISERDAHLEGCEPSPEKEHDIFAYTKGFIKLWESINGPGSWAVNPWVWAVEFKLLGGAA